MTAANWTLFPKPAASRDEMRERLGFPPDSVVFGLVGAVIWTDPPAYAYGLELVQALRRTDRDDVRVLVVGDGSGLKHLQEAAAEELGTRVILTGAVPHAQVLEYMSAMDVASLPQSTDEIGALRYTSKLSEYISARLPIVTGQIPLAYDLDTGWMWRLPGIGPWDERYVGALAMIMKHLTPEAIAQRRATIPADLREFDGEAQRHRVTAFMTDLLDEVLRST
jgi:glycosyltransferase involved in cell wall biosynthesis